MALSPVQHKSANGSFTTSVAVSFTSSTTTGNLIVVNLHIPGSVTSPTCSDNKSNTYSIAIPQVGTNNSGFMQFYAKNITGGASHTVTCSWSGNAACSISVVEISGADTTAPLDVSASHANPSGTVTSLSTGTTATTAQASEIAIEGIDVNLSTSQTWTSSAGFTVLESVVGTVQNTTGMMGSLILTSTQTVADTIGWTTSTADAVAGVGVYKAAAGGGGGSSTPTAFRTLLGAGQI